MCFIVYRFICSKIDCRNVSRQGSAIAWDDQCEEEPHSFPEIQAPKPMQRPIRRRNYRACCADHELVARPVTLPSAHYAISAPHTEFPRSLPAGPELLQAAGTTGYTSVENAKDADRYRSWLAVSPGSKQGIQNQDFFTPGHGHTAHATFDTTGALSGTFNPPNEDFFNNPNTTGTRVSFVNDTMSMPSYNHSETASYLSGGVADSGSTTGVSSRQGLTDPFNTGYADDDAYRRDQLARSNTAGNLGGSFSGFARGSSSQYAPTTPRSSEVSSSVQSQASISKGPKPTSPSVERMKTIDTDIWGRSESSDVSSSVTRTATTVTTKATLSLANLSMAEERSGIPAWAPVTSLPAIQQQEVKRTRKSDSPSGGTHNFSASLSSTTEEASRTPQTGRSRREHTRNTSTSKTSRQSKALRKQNPKDRKE